MLGIFLDQETTGLDSRKHKVLEIACVLVDLATGEEKGAYHAIVRLQKEDWEARDPLSIMINGFTREEIDAKGKEVHCVSQELIALFQNMGVARGSSVFICQNPSFDRAFFSQFVDPYTQEKLFWPYHWLDLASMYWVEFVKTMQKEHLPLPKEMKLSKDTIAQAFSLEAEAKPHRAMQGVRHLLLCYKSVVGFMSNKI